MKWLIYILFFLLLLSLVNANVYLNDLDKDIYNFGDSVNVSGLIFEDNDSRGMLEIDLGCSKKTPLLVKDLNVKANENFTFNEEISLFSSDYGRCNISVSFTSNTNEFEQVFSKTFNITSDLNANFSIDNNFIQLGKQIEIVGKVSKKDSKPINGIGVLYFILDNKTSSIERADIVNGLFDLRLDTNNYVPGKYNVNIGVNDLFGNKGEFQNALQFTIINEISLFVDTNKKTFLPGSNIVVFGKVNSVLLDNIKDGFVTIKFNDNKYETNLRDNGAFSYEIGVPNNIKSGEYKIEVEAQDKSGNTGSDIISVDILPIPTKLEFIDLDSVYNPDDRLVIKPRLYDQANDLIDEVVNIIVLDPSNKEVFNKAIESGSQSEFQFPDMSNAGNWTIKGDASGVSQEKQIYLNNSYALIFDIENQYLIIRNRGNSKYKGGIQINLTSSDVQSNLVKKTSLNPGEILKLDLGREVKTGNYDVDVNGKKFSNVPITGLGRKPYNDIYWIGIVFVLLLVIYILFFRQRRMIIKKLREKRAALKRRFTDDVEKVKRDISRNHILRKLEEQERKVTKSLKFNFKKEKSDSGFYVFGRDAHKREEKSFDWSSDDKKKEDKKGGLFNMFD